MGVSGLSFGGDVLVSKFSDDGAPVIGSRTGGDGDVVVLLWRGREPEPGGLTLIGFGAVLGPGPEPESEPIEIFLDVEAPRDILFLGTFFRDFLTGRFSDLFVADLVWSEWASFSSPFLSAAIFSSKKAP